MKNIDIDTHVYNRVVDTPDEQASFSPRGEAVAITMRAISSYIASFLDKEGENRALIRELVPNSVQFILRSSEENATWTYNPVETGVRVFELGRNQSYSVPAVIIRENGVQQVPTGAGGISHGYKIRDAESGNWRFATSIVVHLKVSVEITIICYSKADAGKLAGLVRDALFTYRPLTREKGRLTSGSSGSPWEVRIPGTPFTQAAPVREDLAGDPRDSAWSISLSGPEFEYESNQFMVHEHTSYGAKDMLPELDADPFGECTIDAPTEVGVGETRYYSVTNEPVASRTYTDQPSLIIINPETRSVMGLRPGTAKILIREDDEVIAQATVTVKVER